MEIEKKDEKRISTKRKKEREAARRNRPHSGVVRPKKYRAVVSDSELQRERARSAIKNMVRGLEVSRLTRFLRNSESTGFVCEA